MNTNKKREGDRTMKVTKAVIGLCFLGGITAQAQNVAVPIESCAAKFEGFEGKIVEAMNKAGDISVGFQAKIAYNKLGYGAVPQFNASPQDFMELEELGWKRLARQEVARIVNAEFKNANHADNVGFRKKFGGMYPLYLKSYAQIREDMVALGETLSGAELMKARSQMRAELRRTFSAYPIARALQARGPNLRALLSEFWFNHFNVDGTKATLHTLDYEKQLSRRVCGTFLGMLQTSATHPAMLVYLDNFRSTKAGLNKGLNENYARELMELYTLGMGPKSPTEPQSPYDQATVTNVAKLLTGWGIKYERGATPAFMFRMFNHDKTRPKIMGKVYGDGLQGGLDLLKTLASHPRTKRNICTKLASELLGYDVPKGPIDRCIGKWGQYGNLTAMYKSLVTEARFWNGANFNNSVKSPVDLVSSGARAMGYHLGLVDRAYMEKLVTHASMLGVHPRRVPPPTGYPVNDKVWIGANFQAAAVNFAFALASDRLPLELDDGKKKWGLGKEAHIRGVNDANEAVNLVLFQSLFTNPEGYWHLAGRSTLRNAVLNPDYDKTNKVNVPARTINSLVLGSHMFIRK